MNEPQAQYLAPFFVPWLLENDWFQNDYKFYRALASAVDAAETLPDAKTISDAITFAYAIAEKGEGKDKLKLSGCALRAGTILDYLRATQ